MYDALAVLQPLTTRTAALDSSGYNLRSGTVFEGLVARLRVTDYSGAGAGAVWSAKIQHSDDNTTYTDLVSFTPLTVGTAAGNSLQFRKFETRKPYVRASVGLSPTTSSPSISYIMEIGVAYP